MSKMWSYSLNTEASSMLSLRYDHMYELYWLCCKWFSRFPSAKHFFIAWNQDQDKKRVSLSHSIAATLCELVNWVSINSYSSGESVFGHCSYKQWPCVICSRLIGLADENTYRNTMHTVIKISLFSLVVSVCETTSLGRENADLSLYLLMMCYYLSFT